MEAMDAALLLIKQGVIEVRQDGTVWKLRNLNTTPLPAPRRLETKVKAGYLAVRINHNNQAFMLHAHRLVWTVLRGPIPENMTINHLDGVKDRNHLSNLEAVSQGDNNRHAYRVLHRSPPPHVPPRIVDSLAPQAKALRLAGLPYAEIAARLGVSQTTAFRATRLK